ncbi:MAG: hypothetical protein AAGK97_00035 [Bacteroidota bacterium]
MQNHCKHKKKNQFKDKSPLLAFGSTFLLAIIPKCPFCIFAYSSAITLCSGSTVNNASVSKEWFYISLILLAITILIVSINFKGLKTIISLLVILLGGTLLIFGDLFIIPMTSIIGSLLLIIGVWINGSFMWFVKKYFNFTNQYSQS